jgi:hypothetical protein
MDQLQIASRSVNQLIRSTNEEFAVNVGSAFSQAYFQTATFSRVALAFGPVLAEAWGYFGEGEIIGSPAFRKKREKAGPPAEPAQKAGFSFKALIPVGIDVRSIFA